MRLMRLENIAIRWLIRTMLQELVIIPVRRSRLSGEAGASVPEGESHQKSYAAKGSLHEQAYDRLANIKTGSPT